MKIEVLDIKKDGNNFCYLSKISLKDYVENLPAEYTNYDIQRAIVSKNVYLDKLVDTVINKHHIPTIVLVLNKKEIKLKKGNENEISNTDFKILDGLQRTHRLKAIYNSIELIENEITNSNEIFNLSKYQLSRNYSKQLNEINSNHQILRKLLDVRKNHKESIKSLFEENFIWFEIWSHLSTEQEVSKMLVLNAGHKPVKLKHQLELLFLNSILEPLKQVEKTKNFKIFREKEKNSISFTKERQLGEFHFSHLITSIISLDKGKVITTNANLISQIHGSDYVVQDLNIELSFDFFKNLIEFLTEVDLHINVSFPNEISWFGRETTLNGLFGAIGNYCNSKEKTYSEPFDIIIRSLNRSPLILNLSEYNKAKSKLDLSKINYGNVNRKIIYNVFSSILEEEDNLIPIDKIVWENYFKKYQL